jgi:pyruvate-formate lyase-activating enzyme
MHTPEAPYVENHSVIVAGHGLVSDVIRFSSVDGPGNRFVAFLQGYNHPHDPAPQSRWTSVTELVDEVREAAPFLSGVTASGDATQQWQFVRDWFTALRDDPRLARLTRFVDSNGAAELRVWDELDPVMDAAMIDLRAFDDDVHRPLTGMSNEPVLETIRLLAGRGKLHEVRLPMLPGVNDDQAMVRRTAAWLHDLDPAVRVKVTAFRCHEVLPTNHGLREPSVYRMAGYAELLRAEGIQQLTFA